MTIIGIDVSKDHLDLAALDGEQVQHWQIANTLPAIAEAVEHWSRIPPQWLVVEATGPYHAPLLSALLAAELSVALVNPAQIAAFRQSWLGRSKTDRQDALLLARFADQHAAALRPAVLPAPQHTELRAAVAYRDRQVAHRTQVLNQQEAARWQQSEQVAEWLAADRAQVEQQLVTVEQTIARLLAEAPEAAILEAIPGVGPRVSAAVLAYLPRACWGHAKAAAAYAGVHPRQEQSGRRSQSRLSKQGHRRLRRYLYMAALVALRHNERLRAFYERLVGRGMARQAAVCAVMHKLLRQMMGRLRQYYTTGAMPMP